MSYTHFKFDENILKFFSNFEKFFSLRKIAITLANFKGTQKK